MILPFSAKKAGMSDSDHTAILAGQAAVSLGRLVPNFLAVAVWTNNQKCCKTVQVAEIKWYFMTVKAAYKCPN
jgi:hypothetical protein